MKLLGRISESDVPKSLLEALGNPNSTYCWECDGLRAPGHLHASADQKPQTPEQPQRQPLEPNPKLTERTGTPAVKGTGDKLVTKKG